MKKVTLTFIVDDKVADDVQNELSWGEMGNAASILNANCEESDYTVESDDTASQLASLYFGLSAAEKDRFLKLTGNQ